MELSEIQKLQEQFIRDRRWERFPPSDVFVHLIEELGEVGSHLLYYSKYKVKGLGHQGGKKEVNQEIAQVFNLFLQLCMHLEINLEEVWKEEYERNLERFDAESWQNQADIDLK